MRAAGTADEASPVAAGLAVGGPAQAGALSPKMRSGVVPLQPVARWRSARRVQAKLELALLHQALLAGITWIDFSALAATLPPPKSRLVRSTFCTMLLNAVL